MADFASLAKEASEGGAFTISTPVIPEMEAQTAAGDTPPEATGEKPEHPEEEESTAHFEPVVQLEEIETKTYEEDEEVLFKQRAKLFVFGETLLNKGSGTKSWNERGVGEIKFLKHKEHEKIRVLMRQEKTMKVIANHVVDPRIELLPNAGSDRSWVWTAFDYAEGDLAETVFAIRFGNAENATGFKTKFEEVKEEMKGLLAGEDAGTTEEGEEAAAALASLSVKKDEAEA
ncbi:unnamed protein product [Chrysoparadoxa australica]